MDELLGDTIFLDWLPKGSFKRPGASLADLSGERFKSPPDFKSYVTTTAVAAWEQPIGRLTCEHVRLLTGQQFGLKWLGRPVAQFVEMYPAAEVTFYPGDLTMAALQAFEEIAAHDPDAARLLREADYGWMRERFTFSRSLVREAEALVVKVQG
ncbi:MAG TPA: contact-dependent growth inhibition system immunity protein [Allosphingosinicella sp.]|jgi:hypothetical protein